VPRRSVRGSSPAEELSEGVSGEAVRRNRRKEDEHRHVLAEVDVRHLLEEADMPASGGALVFLRLLVSEEERQLERSWRRSALLRRYRTDSSPCETNVRSYSKASFSRTRREGKLSGRVKPTSAGSRRAENA